MAAPESQLHRTLNDLEGAGWSEPDYASPMVQRIRALGGVPIGQIAIADVRLLIDQGRALRSLVPLALARLAADPFIEAEYYPGDLLAALFRVPDEFWNAYPDLRLEARAIVGRAREAADTRDPDIPPELVAALSRQADRFA